MTDAALAQRPRGLREGAAIFYAGGAPPAPTGSRPRPAFKPEPRTPCPEDNELLRPVSVGALSYAYARARACFEKQIAAGKSWRDDTCDRRHFGSGTVGTVYTFFSAA